MSCFYCTLSLGTFEGASNTFFFIIINNISEGRSSVDLKKNSLFGSEFFLKRFWLNNSIVIIMI